MLELGAGCGLPSLVAACSETPPTLVVATDYPDALIMDNLSKNIERNSVHFSPGCRVLSHGFEWGSDPRPLLYATSHNLVIQPLHSSWGYLVICFRVSRPMIGQDQNMDSILSFYQTYSTLIGRMMSFSCQYHAYLKNPPLLGYTLL